jgi:lipopolysaccharide export system protein LptA
LRTLKPFIIFLISLCLLGLNPSYAVSAKSKEKLKKAQKKQPIEIQSDKLRSENEGKKFIFSGNVLSTWGDLIIKSDILEVYANPKSKVDRKKATDDVSQAGQDLDKIIAIGNVDIKKGDRRAKGDRAHYDNKKQIITITGKPHATAWEAKNIIKGGKMVFHLEKDLFEVNDRVRLVLTPRNPPPEKKR